LIRAIVKQRRRRVVRGDLAAPIFHQRQQGEFFHFARETLRDRVGVGDAFCVFALTAAGRMNLALQRPAF
jgi:hypothetical protein